MCVPYNNEQVKYAARWDTDKWGEPFFVLPSTHVTFQTLYVVALFWV